MSSQAYPDPSPLYGLMAEFDSPDKVLKATQAAFDKGYRKMDAYSPFPIHGLAEAVGNAKNTVGWICFVGGVAGAMFGFGLLYYVNVIDYPLNIGGRPYNSWPSFIPITFECMVLFAALSAVGGMLALNGLPMHYHPVFNNPEFQLASTDRFFLCIEHEDPLFDLNRTREFLASFSPLSLKEVES